MQTISRHVCYRQCRGATPVQHSPVVRRSAHVVAHSGAASQAPPQCQTRSQQLVKFEVTKYRESLFCRNPVAMMNIRQDLLRSRQSTN